ncbi:MAG TPA: hypothetical protein VEK07_14645 [Polyangiaceae bacterium]|nr:hypothetical protein [Polyangiaceae bacterium]
MARNFRYGSAISTGYRVSGAVATLPILAAVVGCATSSPAAKTAADSAHVVAANRCADVEGDSNLNAVLSGEAVDYVKPLYANLSDPRGSQESQLRGATVMVRALPGMTAEWLDRQLKCHSATETLGQSEAPSTDPFFLPGTPVTIAVRPLGSAFAVDISAFPPKAAHRILNRANDWLASRAAAASL